MCVRERVVEENVTETRRDHATNAEAHQTIHGGLSRRTDSEVSARQRDDCVTIRLLIENVIGLLRTVCVKAPIMEKNLRETRTFWHLVETSRTKLIGVEVRFVEWYGYPGQSRERLHGAHFLAANSRTSNKWPRSAAAAAIAGLIRCVRPPGPCR